MAKKTGPRELQKDSSAIDALAWPGGLVAVTSLPLLHCSVNRAPALPRPTARLMRATRARWRGRHGDRDSSAQASGGADPTRPSLAVTPKSARAAPPSRETVSWAVWGSLKPTVDQ